MMWTLVLAHVLSLEALNVEPLGELPEADFYGREEAWIAEPSRACKDESRPLWERMVTTHRLYMQPMIQISTKAPDAPRVRHTTALSGVCGWVNGLASQRHEGAQFARQAFELLCQQCHDEPCARRPLTKGALGFATDLPSSGGCVYIDQLPVFHGQQPGTKLRWELHIDYSVFAKAFGGLLLMCLANQLSQNAMLHMAIGGAGCLGALSCLTLWWIGRRIRAFGSLLPALVVLAAVGCTYLFDTSLDVHWLSSRLSLMGASDFQNPTEVASWAMGVAVILFVACVLLGARLGLRFFASPEDPTGEVTFDIGLDGRRIDHVAGVPLQQWILSWVLWVLGALLLCRSTQEPLASLSLFVLALIQARLRHALFMWRVACTASSPSHWRNLVSLDAYNAQGKRHTAMALASLSAHMRNHPELFCKLSEGSERASRRFSLGAPHAEAPMEWKEKRSLCSML